MPHNDGAPPFNVRRTSQAARAAASRSRQALGAISGGRRRGGGTQWAIAPWIVLSVVGVLLASGLAAGYAWLAKSGCSGSRTTLTVLASPDHATVLAGLAEQWSRTEHEVGGRCAVVDVQTKDSATTAAALGNGWDQRRDGPRPDVWAPESRMWAQVAAASSKAAEMLPADSPSLATSVVVIAMPAPMAKVIGDSGGTSWSGLLTGLRSGWSARSHPEWGRFVVGMPDPATSTAGLHTMLTVTDANADGVAGADELTTATALARATGRTVADTADLLSGLASADQTSEKAALAYVSAFPATERDVTRYNLRNPRVPLTALYPAEGSVDTDHPYLVLDAPWMDQTRREIAAQFVAFATSEDGIQAYQAEGFRNADRSALVEAGDTTGVRPEPGIPSREPESAGAVATALAAWSGASTPVNVLFVIDVSESVAQPSADSGLSRLEVMKRAVSAGLEQLPDEAKAGVWAFSTELTDATDWSVEAKYRPMNQSVDGSTQREFCLDAVSDLRAKSGSALYDTALAAFRAASDQADADRRNLVILITDGGNVDSSGVGKAELLSTLKKEQSTDEPVRLMTLGDSEHADSDVLSEIASATGGTSAEYQDANSLKAAVLAAILGLPEADSAEGTAGR